MRLDVVAENWLERAVLAADLAPKPLAQTLISLVMTRSLMVGTKLGVFDLLATGDRTAAELAADLGTDGRASEKLLNALVGMGYLRVRDGRYGLTRTARKWLPAGSAHSMRDYILEAEQLEWQWMTRLEDFVRTGAPLNVHEGLSADQWRLYQRGMRAVASFAAKEIARRVPVPKGATDMLDIGGSHGYHSVAICRRHRGLRSTIMDLPEAVEQARPILAREGMGDRVVHQAGNALTEDLGSETFDVVYISQLVHHFTEEDNRELARRVARALRPGGFYVIYDVIRPRSPKEGGQLGTMTDLFFALTSASGTWSLQDMASWQRQAGLEPQDPIRLRTAPGAGIQAAKKLFE